MYSIIANGREIGITERPTYIRQQRNGTYALCDENIAQGIVFEGTPYQLADHASMTGELTAVRVVEINAGARILAQETVASIAFVTLAEAGNIDDVTAGENMDLFIEWSGDGVSYTKGQLRRFNGNLYRVLQDHVSQPDWTPDVAVSLFVKVADPSIEWPDWSQPQGAHDAYRIDAKCSRFGKHYINERDYNVQPPEAPDSGWREVQEG